MQSLIKEILDAEDFDRGVVQDEILNFPAFQHLLQKIDEDTPLYMRAVENMLELIEITYRHNRSNLAHIDNCRSRQKSNRLIAAVFTLLGVSLMTILSLNTLGPLTSLLVAIAMLVCIFLSWRHIELSLHQGLETRMAANAVERARYELERCLENGHRAFKDVASSKQILNSVSQRRPDIVDTIH